MKKLFSLFFIAVLLLTSCDGIVRTKKYTFNTIYLNDLVLEFPEKIEINRGDCKLNSLCYKSKLSFEEQKANLEKQGATFLDMDSTLNCSFFQMNDSGMWSIKWIKNDDGGSIYEIVEMSFYVNDEYIPFPIYSVYKNTYFNEVKFNTIYNDVNIDYTFDTIFMFNSIVNVYSSVVVDANTLIIEYKDKMITLNVDNKALSFSVK